jgi:hypothetical protein
MTRNPKAEMFNRKASDPKNKPDEILKALGLRVKKLKSLLHELLQ